MTRFGSRIEPITSLTLGECANHYATDLGYHANIANNKNISVMVQFFLSMTYSRSSVFSHYSSFYNLYLSHHSTCLLMYFIDLSVNSIELSMCLIHLLMYLIDLSMRSIILSLFRRTLPVYHWPLVINLPNNVLH